jgi:hypothetical protein
MQRTLVNDKSSPSNLVLQKQPIWRRRDDGGIRATLAK